MAGAKLLYCSKIVYPDGAIREMVIWKLPEATAGKKHGLKYRLYYGNADGKCLIRYDNETGKGDHRHFCDREKIYHFVNVETLVANFQKDIDKLRRNK